MAREPPPPDEAHVWFAEPEACADAALVEAYITWLSPEERARRLRFHFDEHRHEYLITRALVRSTLSRYADVAPEDWQFRPNAYGRPEIAGPVGPLGPNGAPPLRFNLSNTKGLVVCAVTSGREVGVDVEYADRAVRSLEVADRFFAPSEVEALFALPQEAQGERFIMYWTLKESYIKARGMGLAIPLDHFAFVIEEGRPPSITFDPRLKDDPDAWQFSRFRPTKRHRIALALAKGEPQEERARVVVRRTVPLIY